jgi:hypothetical protein
MPGRACVAWLVENVLKKGVIALKDGTSAANEEFWPDLASRVLSVTPQIVLDRPIAPSVAPSSELAITASERACINLLPTRTARG